MPAPEEGSVVGWDFDVDEIVYVEVGDDNIVLDSALVISAEDAPDEATGQIFCMNLLNSTNRYIRVYKTKLSISPRKIFPKGGDTYDPITGYFKSSKPLTFEGKTPISLVWSDSEWNWVEGE